MPIHRVLEIMEEDAGRVLDPHLFAIFKELLREGKIAAEGSASVRWGNPGRGQGGLTRSRSSGPARKTIPLPLPQGGFGNGKPTRMPVMH